MTDEADHIRKALKTVEANKGLTDDERYGVRGGQGRSAGEIIENACMLALTLVCLVMTAFIVQQMFVPCCQ